MQISQTRPQINYAAALALVEAALTHARDNGWEVAAAVTDPFGTLVAFGRTDGAAPPVAAFAVDKAYTAGTLRKSTRAFGDRMAASPTLSLGLATRQRFIAWGGGLAVFEEGACIGGLGVSGAQEHEDIACAEAAIRALGLTPG